MGIKINSSVWNSIFAVPTALVDDHIKLAGGQQLRVLLYILRHNNENIDTKQIAVGCGMSESDVKDAMQYWVTTGFIGENCMEPVAVVVHSKEAVTVKEVAPLTEIPDVAPTYQQVAQRMLEAPEVRALFNEAQLKFGRTVGYNDQATLLMMYDYYGLPVEVILTIIQYAISEGKCAKSNNLSYIKKVSKDWADNGINTLEAADEHIRRLKATEKLWKKFESMFTVDPPKYTEKRSTYLKKWHLENKQSLELIYYAYEETVNRINKPEFGYMDKMLTDWKEKRFKSPTQVMQAPKESVSTSKKTFVKKGAEAVNATASYDSDKYKKKAQAPIEYKRRNTNG